MSSSVRDYVVPLGLYRQGDDLQACLEWAEHDVPVGLRTYAAGLEEAVNVLHQLANFIEDHAPDTIVYGDKHVVRVRGEELVLDQLLADEVLAPDPDLDDVDPVDMAVQDDDGTWCCGQCGCETN